LLYFIGVAVLSIRRFLNVWNYYLMTIKIRMVQSK
jgi:hypothetical protein